MRTISLSLVLTLAAISMFRTPGVRAAQLFDRSSATAPKSESITVDAVAETLIDVDAGAVTRETRTLTFVLPDGKAYSAEQDYFRQYDADWLVWAGSLREAASASTSEVRGSVLVNVYRGMVSAVIRADGTDYSIVPVPGLQTGRLMTMGTTRTSCPVTAHPHPPIEGLRKAMAPDTPKPLTGCAPASPLPTQSVIDVMTLYTRDHLVSASAEASAQSFIATAIANANLIFARSQVPTEYRLVHMGPLPPSSLVLDLTPETQGNDDNKAITAALEWMNGQPPELISLRNAYGADMVALFIPPVIDTQKDRCGRANLPLNIAGSERIRRISGLTEPFDQRAFIALEMGCGQTDYTYAHEHGHNFSMSHEGTDSGLIYPYASGHILNPGEKSSVATVMGCVLTGTSAPDGVCKRIPHFSNPDVCYDDLPTGTAADANNAQVARLRSPMYASMRPTITNATPSLTITAPADGTVIAAGQTVTLTATASDPGNPNLTSSIQWTSNLQPFNAQGSPVAATLHAVGTHVLTAAVTDSGNKRVERSVRVIVQGGPPELSVKQGATDYASGSTYAFPTLSVDALPYTRVFLICNSGSSALTLANTQLVTGTGYSQQGQPSGLVLPGDCTPLSIRFHAENPGTYTGQLRFTNNDADENPYTLALTATAAPSSVQLIASYVPSAGAARVTFASSSLNVPTFDYYFDPNQGRFEERPAAPCHRGITNPAYLTVRLGGSVLNTGGIAACTYQASWDSTPFTCSADVVATLNTGQDIIINTDDARQDLYSCAEDRVPQFHVRHNEVHSMQVNFTVGTRTHSRKINFRRTTKVIRATAAADTYVTAGLGVQNNANKTFLQVRESPAMRSHGFVRFAGGSAGFATIHSAQLRIVAVGNPIDTVYASRQAFSQPWDDATLSFSNWSTQTGGDTGLATGVTGVAANRSAGIDVSNEITAIYPTWAYVFRLYTTDTRDLRWIGSAENGAAGVGATESRPVLYITTNQ